MKKERFEDWILLEDDDLIVINKPPNISVLDERSGEHVCVLQLARVYCETAQVCHRIDKETSGLLVIAKNPNAYREMSMLFEKRLVQKIYHAVCESSTDFMDYLINLPIYTTNRGKAKVSTREGKESQTLVNTLEKFKHFTFVECKPHTGRMHQIRVHLAAVETPVVADVLYGATIPFLSAIKRKFKLGKGVEERPMIERLALHARGLSFKLGKGYTLEAPYPKDFEALLNILRKYDSL